MSPRQPAASPPLNLPPRNNKNRFFFPVFLFSTKCNKISHSLCKNIITLANISIHRIIHLLDRKLTFQHSNNKTRLGANLFCTILLDHTSMVYGWHVTTSWVRCPLWINQPGQLSLPSLKVGTWVITWITGVETIKRQTRTVRVVV